MSKNYGIMIGNKDAIEFANNKIRPLAEKYLPEEKDTFERFMSRIEYACDRMDGVLPVYHKGKSIHDYWSCGSCGYQGIREVHWKYCPNCGIFLTTRFPNYKNEKKKLEEDKERKRNCYVRSPEELVVELGEQVPPVARCSLNGFGKEVKE